jgi:hypothetical protein
MPFSKLARLYGAVRVSEMTRMHGPATKMNSQAGRVIPVTSPVKADTLPGLREHREPWTCERTRAIQCALA